jgi:hypothetical protein
VVDDEKHLLGAVTVDDLLDHLLPHDWRVRQEDPELPGEDELTDAPLPAAGGPS